MKLCLYCKSPIDNPHKLVKYCPGKDCQHKARLERRALRDREETVRNTPYVKCEWKDCNIIIRAYKGKRFCGKECAAKHRAWERRSETKYRKQGEGIGAAIAAKKKRQEENERMERLVELAKIGHVPCGANYPIWKIRIMERVDPVTRRYSNE